MVPSRELTYPPSGKTDELRKRFPSEKLPNWSILVETFTNMGKKEPNSTCFIARFLNHQLGVAMGVMIHPPNKKLAFDTKMVNLIPRLQQSKCYRVCVFPYLSQDHH